MLDFGIYDLIIDARSEREFEEDHIPGAVNMPVVNTVEYAEVGTLHRTDKMGAYKIGVQYSLKNIAKHIADDITRYSDDARILVYCFRGGKRSKLWCDSLETIGYKVDRLRGGWKEYRRWVNESLANVPTYFRYRVLHGPTGCGKTRLLKAIQAAGGQALDLEGLARHNGSVLGAIPGVEQPSQKYFDSLLLEQLKKFDTSKPVWIESESKKIGRVQVPDSLLATMRNAAPILIEANMANRVQLWREDYRHFEENPLGMLEQLRLIRQLVGGDEFAVWEDLAQRQAMPELFERLMKNHYDPSYKRSFLRHYPTVDAPHKIELHDLSPAGLRWVADRLLQSFEV